MLTNWLQRHVSPKSTHRRRTRQFSQWSPEKLEPRIVLTPPPEALSALYALRDEINAEFGEANNAAVQFLNQTTNTVTQPLISGPLSPLTSQFGTAAAGTMTGFQNDVSSTIGVGQSYFNALSGTVAGWLNTPVAATLDVGGGTWDVWT